MLSAFHRITPYAAAENIRRSRAGLGPLALFDSRDQASYSKSHIKGADHLNEAGFGQAIFNLPKNVPVMIYCYHGNASQIYAEMFADFHFQEVYSVDGGYEALAPILPDPPTLNKQSSQLLRNFIREYHFDPDNLDNPWDHALTPLMRAALLGHEELVRELVHHGVNIHLRNSDGNNALWLACVSDHAGMVAHLIETGIDLDNRNATGATTLMYTASSGKAKLMKILLDAGADPWLRNDDDYLAVELAATEECLGLLRHTLNA